MMSSPAWQRKEGKNPAGGLNAKGRASAKAQGSNLQAPVKGKPKTISEMRRKGSFLSRAGGTSGPMKKPDGSPTRLLLSYRAWGASSREDAKRLGKYWLERYHNEKKKKGKK